MGECKYQKVALLFQKEGVTIGPDGHFYDQKGNPKSRISRNGYYTCRKMVDNCQYHLMEHRLIWVWIHGSIDENLEINHIDYDRTNNYIENLELVTRKENVAHSIENITKATLKGVDSPKASLTKSEVNLIRLLNRSGYRNKDITELMSISPSNTVSRVITRARYGSVEDDSEFFSLYQAFVDKLRNKSISKEEELTNYTMGLAGEAGEVSDIVKKHLYHGHDLNEDHLVEELGDVLFYIVAIADTLGIDFSDIIRSNAEKLDKRYPEGFSKVKSINR